MVDLEFKIGDLIKFSEKVWKGRPNNSAYLGERVNEGVVTSIKVTKALNILVSVDVTNSQTIIGKCPPSMLGMVKFKPSEIQLIEVLKDQN